jgi:hypothetical protein
MRAAFPGYYRPTEDELSAIWDNCAFVLDANVLLNLYRYSPSTREQLLEILKPISDRLWIPNQAALEYQRNRMDVIAQQMTAYENVKKLLDTSRNRLKNEIQSLTGKGKHPFIDSDHLMDRLAAAFTEIQVEMDELGQQHPDFIIEDSVRGTITDLLEGKIGPPYPAERLAEIYETGKARYDAQTPPGYLDAAKGDTRQYGDLVMWFQIIDQAKTGRKPMLLVTDDRKDDWWHRFRGKTIGPRPELVNELHALAEVPFQMYSADPFMEHARQYLGRQISEQAIEEVREVRRHDEEQSRTISLARAAFHPYESIEAMRRLQDEAMEALRVAPHLPREIIEAIEASRHLPIETMDAIRAATHLPKDVVEAIEAARHLPLETLESMRRATLPSYPTIEVTNPARFLSREAKEPPEVGDDKREESDEDGERT